jgi:putative transposase
LRPTSGAASSRSLPQEVRGQLSDELIDEFLVGRRTEAEVVGRDGLLGQLTKRLVERAMAGELSAHLGYEPHHEPPGGTGNTRNGSTPKTIQTRQGPVARWPPPARRCPSSTAAG